MERDQQRQNRRNIVSGFSCTAGAELNFLQDPSGRTGPSCDPAPAVPAAFPAVLPNPCPPPLPVPLNLPDGLIVPSDATVAYCPSTAGYSVTGTTASALTAGAQNQTVLFTVLENISENQLNYLSTVVPSSSAAIIAAALSGATSSVISLTHLNYTQSEELILFIQDAKFTVNTLAVEQARNLLVCQVENNLQSAVCPTAAYFGPSAAVPAGLPYVPSAIAATGSVLVTFALLPSTGGQTAFTLLNIPSLTAAAAQANSIALSQAESSLRCVFGNTATDAACCTSQAPNNNLGFTYCVPATGPTIPGSATAVGYFSVAANTIFSVVSATEANSVARELSRNSLNCYFPSVGTTATCSGTATSVGLTGLGLTGPFASVANTAVFLEPGAVILYELTSSVTAANQQAAILALASLNCFWSNTLQTASCPTAPGFTAINNQYYILDASPTESTNYSSSTTADTVISYSSQSDSNQQALQLAAASISCIYCNDAVPPTCTGGVNETVGTIANLICSTIAEVAQNTAISIGNILVSSSGGQLNCCYGNDDVFNTIFCSTGAFRNGDFIKRKNKGGKGGITPSDSFSSEDSFFIPANVITVCYDTPSNTAGPSLFQYSNLYAGTSPQAAACLDTAPCSVTSGSATALPPLWAAQTDLFSAIAAGTTFYSNTAQAPYTFNPTYPYIVDRSFTFRNYRTATGGTGFTTGLTSYSCSNYTPYTFRGATLGNYPGSSATLALQDIFCSSSGPTAGLITLYSISNNPFVTGNTSAWYSDACGLAAFNPVSSTATAAQYFAGIIEGGAAAYISFSTSGSNVATYQGLYNLSTCSTGPWPDTNTSPTAGGDTYVSYTEPTATGNYKQEANDIAQNIVNSFVRCYYLNDRQVSGPCPLGLVTVQVGVVEAGEVVSMISKEVANDTAIDMAEGRRICLNEELIGRPCTETTIGDADVTILGNNLNLTFDKSLCSFTPTLELDGAFDTTPLHVASASIKKLTICTAAGNEDIYVPYWSEGDASEGDIANFFVENSSTIYFNPTPIDVVKDEP